MRVFLVLVPLLTVGLGFVNGAQAIGTPEACEANHGQWRTYSEVLGNESCAIKATEAECQAKKGWQSHDRKECNLPMTNSERATRCETKGGVWGHHGARRLHCYFAAHERECIDSGGAWQRLGRMQIHGCVHKAADAGKPCKDSAECQLKRCLFIGAAPAEGTSAQGICMPTSDSFGCYRAVRNGRVMPEICQD